MLHVSPAVPKPSSSAGRGGRSPAVQPSRTSSAEPWTPPKSASVSWCWPGDSWHSRHPGTRQSRHGSVEVAAVFQKLQLSSHRVSGVFLLSVLRRRTPTRLQRGLHALDEAAALHHLLLQRAVVIHVTDGVAAVPVGERSIGGVAFQLSVRIKRVCEVREPVCSWTDDGRT